MISLRIILASLVLVIGAGLTYTFPQVHLYSHKLLGDFHSHGVSHGVNEAFAATSVSSVKSGNWSDPAVWSTGSVPSATDSVTVSGGHTVTYNLSDSMTSGVTITDNAKLAFAPGQTTLLRTDKNILVRGELEMRPSSASIHHTIRFVNVDESKFVGGGRDVLDSDVGLWVRGNGQLDIAGTPKTSWTRLQSGANAGNTSITLQAAPAGWQVGDEVSIVPTEPPNVGDAAWNGFEVRTIAAISGNIVTLDHALSRDHPVATDPDSGKSFTAEVLNLSRNVHIEGTGNGSADPAQNGRAHIQIISAVPQFISYAELKLLGPRFNSGDCTESVVGRYPLHFHHSMDGSRGSLIEGVVVRNSGNRAFVPHASHGIVHRDTIAYDVFDDAYWWDPPSSGHKLHTTNNSSDTLFDRAVAAIVITDPAFRGYRLSGFELMAGMNNTIRDSVAVGVQGNGDASGFEWPESVNQNVGGIIWGFNQGNISHNNKVHGIFTWQNDFNTHLIQDFVAYHNQDSAVDHGAYVNAYQYLDVTAFGNGGYGLQSHAAAVAIDIGRTDGYSLAFERYQSTERLLFPKHNADPGLPTLFKDCMFSGVVINDGSDNGQFPTKADFVNCRKPDGSGFEPADFTLQNVISGLDIRVQRPNDTAFRLQDGGITTTIGPFYQTAPNPTPNQPPSVGTGPDLTITLPSNAALGGSVSDDGLPSPPTTVSTLWSVVSGPGSVTFTDATDVHTTATFTLEGTYVLRLSADDGDLASSDNVTITVTQQSNANPPFISNLSAASGSSYPVVADGFLPGASVFTDRAYTFTSIPSALQGSTYIRTANSDKNRSNDAFLSFLLGQDATIYVAYDSRATSLPNWLASWVPYSGTVGTTDVPFKLYSRDFADGSSVSLGGNKASGSAGASSNYFVVAVPSSHFSSNLPPIVDAGPDVVITLPIAASLNGNVSDDGLPSPPSIVSTLWSVVSGPASVAFDDATATDTTVTFTLEGTYVLRLSANDSNLSSSDDVTVTVTQPDQQAPAAPNLAVASH